jgi:hypothetical protein
VAANLFGGVVSGGVNSGAEASSTKEFTPARLIAQSNGFLTRYVFLHQVRGRHPETMAVSALFWSPDEVAAIFELVECCRQSVSYIELITHVTGGCCSNANASMQYL